VILDLSESALEDSIVAIGFPICFYYCFTGIACIVYYRHELTRSVRDFLLLGLAPLLGALMLFGVARYAAVYCGHAENVSSKPILDITLPLWMGIGGMLIGVVLMLISRPFFRDFFSRKLETAEPGLLEKHVEHHSRGSNTAFTKRHRLSCHTQEPLHRKPPTGPRHRQFRRLS
jgi:hypothetical protein